MANYSRIEVVIDMKETGLVPVFYHSDLAICKRVIKVCYEAGIRVFEFTNRGDYAHEVFSELSKYAHQEFLGLKLGVGSIVDAATASLFIQSGADFVVSPVLNPEVGKTCNRRKIAWVPGCGSLSEISQAEELGAEVVKIFPGSVLGPEFVKAVNGPCPWTSIMPTGGVGLDEKNLKEWFNAGVHCVGIGSKLFKPELLVEGQESKLRDIVSSTLTKIQKVRN